MNQADAAPHGLAGLLIPLTVIAIMFAIRLRRMGRERPLKLERLWLLPAFYGAFAALMLVAAPPVGMGWAWLLLAVGAGTVAGWLRGKTMRIALDEETGALKHAQSPAALLFLLALVVLRTGSRMYLEAGGGLSHSATLLLTDVLIGFALGVLSAQRLEMYLRGKRLLQARGA